MCERGCVCVWAGLGWPLQPRPLPSDRLLIHLLSATRSPPSLPPSLLLLLRQRLLCSVAAARMRGGGGCGVCVIEARHAVGQGAVSPPSFPSNANTHTHTHRERERDSYTCAREGVGERARSQLPARCVYVCLADPATAVRPAPAVGAAAAAAATLLCVCDVTCCFHCRCATWPRPQKQERNHKTRARERMRENGFVSRCPCVCVVWGRCACLLPCSTPAFCCPHRMEVRGARRCWCCRVCVCVLCAPGTPARAKKEYARRVKMVRCSSAESCLVLSVCV
jgi:hypothetical protein